MADSKLTSERAEYLIESLIGWAVRGAEIPGRVTEWREILRLVKVGQASEAGDPQTETEVNWDRGLLGH